MLPLGGRGDPGVPSKCRNSPCTRPAEGASAPRRGACVGPSEPRGQQRGLEVAEAMVGFPRKPPRGRQQCYPQQRWAPREASAGLCHRQRHPVPWVRGVRVGGRHGALASRTALARSTAPPAKPPRGASGAPQARPCRLADKPQTKTRGTPRPSPASSRVCRGTEETQKESSGALCDRLAGETGPAQTFKNGDGKNHNKKFSIRLEFEVSRSNLRKKEFGTTHKLGPLKP